MRSYKSGSFLHGKLRKKHTSLFSVDMDAAAFYDFFFFTFYFYPFWQRFFASLYACVSLRVHTIIFLACEFRLVPSACENCNFFEIVRKSPIVL